jgi:hypothetical protein
MGRDWRVVRKLDADVALQRDQRMTGRLRRTSKMASRRREAAFFNDRSKRLIILDSTHQHSLGQRKIVSPPPCIHTTKDASHILGTPRDLKLEGKACAAIGGATGIDAGVLVKHRLETDKGPSQTQ